MSRKPIFVNPSMLGGDLAENIRDRIDALENSGDDKYAAYYVTRWGTVLGITRDLYDDGMFWSDKLGEAMSDMIDPELGTRRISEWTEAMHKEYFTA